MSINYNNGFTYTIGSVGALASIETAPGVYSLVIGSSLFNTPILVRDSSYSVFSDVGTAYEAGFIVGSIVLASPGDIAEIEFITSDFVRVGSSPSLGILPDEISGNFYNISGFVVQDPPLLYGIANAPVSLYANRYYLKQTIASANPPPNLMRHCQIIVDFGNTDAVQNEILSMTFFGAIT